MKTEKVKQYANLQDKNLHTITGDDAPRLNPRPAPSPATPPSSCIPPNVKYLKVKSFMDLLALGQYNLKSFINYWRHEEIQIGKKIDATFTTWNFLHERTSLQQLQNYAHEFTNPDPSEWITDWTDPHIPAPLEKATPARAKNTTNLQICGWCKFCDSGWRRQNCNLCGHCRLLPWSADWHEHTYGPCRFNQPCFFLKQVQLDPSVITDVLDQLRKDLTDLREQRSTISHRIGMLVAAKSKSVTKPAFPDQRHYNALNPGMRVKLILSGLNYDISDADRQAVHSGTIVEDTPTIVFYNPEDQSQRNIVANHAANIQASNGITVRLDQPIDGIGSCLQYTSSSSIFVLPEGDFYYLVNHPEDWPLWLSSLQEHPEQAERWRKAFEETK